MLGESMISWFDLFSGITVHKITENDSDNNQGWVNIDEYIRCFERSNLSLNGTPYRKEDKRDEELQDSIINNANILCRLGLLEKNRGTHPPRLEYRVSPKGRKFDSLKFSKFGNIRRKLFFFSRALLEKCKKYKVIITAAAFGMAVVNAVKFTTLAVTWLTDIWGVVSSLVGIILIVLAAALHAQ